MRGWLVPGCGALLGAWAGSADAHVGGSHALAWNWDPLLVGGMMGLTGAYALGIRDMWRSAGVGRVLKARQVVAFGLGMLTLVLALLSPLDALSDQLSSAHMVQHMLLMVVAAPLLVLGYPLMAVLWALPAPVRRRVGRVWRRLRRLRPVWYWVFQPVTLWLLYALTLWIWHLPSLYEAALRFEGVHALQHAAFLGASILFWWVLFDPIPRLRLNRGLGVLYLFSTTLHATLLGVFMALAPSPWYPAYLDRTQRFGLMPLEDQQLAGLVMWMPACAVYALVAAWLFFDWLEAPEQRRLRS